MTTSMELLTFYTTPHITVVMGIMNMTTE